MRDALRELNLTLRDSQQWQAQNRQQQAAQGLQELSLRNRLANDLQQRKINRARVAQAEEAMKPRPINVFDFLDDTPTSRELIFGNGGGMSKELGSVFGAGAKVGSDGMVTDSLGNSIKVNKFQFDSVVPALFSIATKYDDPRLQASNNIAGINSQISDLDNQLKKMPKGAVQFQTKRAEIEAQKNNLMDMRKQQEANMQPKNILQVLRDNYDNIQQFGVAAASRGANAQTMNIINGSLAQTAGRIKSLEDNLLRTELEITKQRLKNKGEGGKGQMFTAFQLNDNGDIVNSKQIPVSKQLGAGSTPYDADPTLDKTKKWVWSQAFTSQMSKEKSPRDKKKWMPLYDRLRKDFSGDMGYGFKGPISGMNFNIGSYYLDQLLTNTGLSDEERKRNANRSEQEKLNVARSYAKSGQALKEYDMVVNNIKVTNADNPAKMARALQNAQDSWLRIVGVRPEYYRKLFEQQQEMQSEMVEE